MEEREECIFSCISVTLGDGWCLSDLWSVATLERCTCALALSHPHTRTLTNTHQSQHLLLVMDLKVFTKQDDNK